MQRMRYLRDPLSYLAGCRRRYGDIFMIRLIKDGVVLVCTPELVREVYTAGDDVLAAGEAKIEIFGKILGHSSTLLLDGPAHVRRRRQLLPQFRGEVMQSLVPVMRSACDRTLNSTRPGHVFPLHPVLHRIAFDVIAEALFSATAPGRRPALLGALHDFAHRAVTSRLLMLPALQRDLGRWSPWGRVQAAVRAAKAEVLGEVRDRRRRDDAQHDLTGLLLAAKGEDDAPLTDDEVCDEVLTMVAAGHETTAMALTWLCYGVFTRPDVMRRLREELHGITDATDIDRLPYLDAVVRESLRFYSLIPNGSGRLVKGPFRLGGHDIPIGAIVSVAFHELHRTQPLFEHADEFRPERFLNAKFSPYESVPFGGGTRRCLGMPFALLEIKLVLAALLERYTLEIAQSDVRPVWRGAFLTPSKGLRVRAISTPAAARA